MDEARESFEQALLLDTTQEFSAIIHFGIGNLYYHQLMSGIQSTVVKSSVGLHSAYKVGEQIPLCMMTITPFLCASLRPLFRIFH